MQQGDVCNTVNFIISGCTKTFYADAEGQEHIVMFAVEDWWTSDLGSFITQNPADFNTQCLENTQVVNSHIKRCRNCMKKSPSLINYLE